MLCSKILLSLWSIPTRMRISMGVVCRGGKIGPIRWASSVLPELGSDLAIKLLARKKSGQNWPGPIWPDPVYPGSVSPNFFCL